MSTPTVNVNITSTPANEWAEDTTTALEQHTASVDGGVGSGYNTTGAGNEQPITTTTNSHPGTQIPASTSTTPGVPGSYPNELNVTEDIANAINTAKQYIPAQEDVQKALATAGETAAQYLPTNIANKLQSYLPGSTANTTDTTTTGIETSLPSTEFSGASVGEHTDGGGALPGLNSETGVAKLPDERETSGQIPTLAGGAASVAYSAREALANSVPSTSTGGNASQTLHEIALKAKTENDTSIGTTSLPSTEISGSQPGEIYDGAGPLPGSQSEASVALLPDERNDLPGKVGGVSKGVFEGAAGAGFLDVGAPNMAVSTPDVTQQNFHPDVSPPAPTHLHDEDIATTNEKLGRLGNTSSQPTAPTPPPKAEDSRKHVSFSKPNPEQADLKTPPVSNTSSTPSVDSGTSANDDAQSPTGSAKPKFMDKVKGEVKIISGKVGGNSEKVAEGKRMKTGTH